MVAETGNFTAIFIGKKTNVICWWNTLALIQYLCFGWEGRSCIGGLVDSNYDHTIILTINLINLFNKMFFPINHTIYKSSNSEKSVLMYGF
jgi:hypothetical protein